jgi:membrane protein
MPGDAYTLFQKALKEVTSNSTGLKLVTGLLLALWSDSGGMRSIMDALNRCYHVKEGRPYFKQVLIWVTMTAVISALTITALVIVLYGGAIAQFVGNHMGLSDVAVHAWQMMQWPIALFFVVAWFAIMYFWSPDVKHDWVWITPGSLIGVLLWVGASRLSSLPALLQQLQQDLRFAGRGHHPSLLAVHHRAGHSHRRRDQL